MLGQIDCKHSNPSLAHQILQHHTEIWRDNMAEFMYKLLCAASEQALLIFSNFVVSACLPK